MHGQAIVGVHAHQDVAKDQRALPLDADHAEVPVLEPQGQGVFGRNVNVADGTDHPLGEVQRALGSDQRDPRGACQVAGRPDRGANAQLELFGHRDLDLGAAALRAKDAHPLHAPPGADEVYRLFAGVLPRLREARAHGQFVPRPKEGIDVLLGEVDVVGRYLDRDRPLLALRRPGRALVPQGADRLAGDHPALLRRNDQNPHRRVGVRDLGRLAGP